MGDPCLTSCPAWTPLRPWLSSYNSTHVDSSEKRLAFALLLTALILIAQIIGGIFTGSLALLSDAAHIFLDMLALAMSYGAIRLASDTRQ